MPQLLCAVSVLLSIFVKLDIALAATAFDSTHYATSFFSLSDLEQAKQLNRKLSEILRSYPTGKVFDITCIPVTSKEKEYFRSIVVTDKKGLHALEKREHEIANVLKQKALKLCSMRIQIERWAYRLTEPIRIRRPKVVPLSSYDKIDIPEAKDKKNRFVILIRRFSSLDEANRFCQELGSRGIEVILAYPRNITGGRNGREIDQAPFRVFIKTFEDTDLVFKSSRQAHEYVRQNKTHLQKKIGEGYWKICHAGYICQLVPRKKYNFHVGSFRLDQLRSREAQLKAYLDALEEREIPFYLTTVSVKKHTYLRVVHVVPDESQVQIDLALERLAEELNDFSAELGKDFRIHPKKIPKDDPLEGAKFTLDDLVIAMSNGKSAFLKEECVDRFSVTSKLNGVPVNVRDLFRELFLPRIHSLENDLKGKNMIGLKVIKMSLPGKGEHTCFAIEQNYQGDHVPLAEKLKATGKILTFFLYRREDKADLNRLAQLAVESEI